MVHLQLFGSDKPVSVIKSDGIYADEIKERYAEYPAIAKKSNSPESSSKAYTRMQVCRAK